jgi:hypothetical protein
MLAGVVGPFARPQAKRPAADHVSEGRMRVAPGEFQGGAERISYRQPEQTANGAIGDQIFGHSNVLRIDGDATGQDMRFLLADPGSPVGGSGAV